MEIFLESLAIILVFEAVLFVLAFFSNRNDIADVGWGLGFGVLALYNYFAHPGPVYFQKVLLLLVLAWSLRLAGYVAYRMRGKSEDQRYKEMREGWKEHWAIKSFFYVFILQGILLWILSLPMISYLSSRPFEASALSWFPVFISLFGLVYETIADLQKSKFKKLNHDPDSFIQSGLFKYSRYPQYFGEMTFWFGIALFPMTIGYQLVFLYAPILLTVLLLKFSGVPLLEKKYLKRKGYKEYAQKTSLLIPNF